MQNQNLVNLQQLLRNKAELHARLQLLPYDGTPEIKTNKVGNKYLYVRKRITGKLTSTYVDVFPMIYMQHFYVTHARQEI